MSTVQPVVLLKENSVALRKENQYSAQDNAYNVVVVHLLASKEIEGSVGIFQFHNIYTHIRRNLEGRTKSMHGIHLGFIYSSHV